MFWTEYLSFVHLFTLFLIFLFNNLMFKLSELYFLVFPEYYNMLKICKHLELTFSVSFMFLVGCGSTK